MAIRIYGASDDLVEIEGDVRKEYNAPNRPIRLLVGSKTEGLIIEMRYGQRASTWQATIGQIDEGVEIP